jgi:predicted GNAT superfamily acetyltransferase
MNVASHAFHERLGFVELGTQVLPGSAKRVSLRALAME